jgi:hypothetical protein
VGLPGIVLVAISVSLGAMTYWAVTEQVNGSRHPRVGPILLLVGAAGTVVSAYAFSMFRSSEHPHHTFDRQLLIPDGGCRSIHQGFKRLTLRVLSSATTRPLHQELARARGTSDRRITFVGTRARITWLRA